MADSHFQEVDFDPFATPEVERAVPAIDPQVEIWTSCLVGGLEANLSYNESVTVAFEGILDPLVFTKAVMELFKRHEALRSVMNEDGSQLLILADAIPDFSYEDLSFGQSESKIAEFVQNEMRKPFDLQMGPLARIKLFKSASEKYHLITSAHHIICDGWSIAVILQDLSRIYNAYASGTGQQIPAAPSFGDYAIRQKQFAETEEYKRTEFYWLQQFSGEIPMVDLPTDRPRPEVRTYNSQRDDFALRPDLVLGIKNAGALAGCSFVSTMIAAFEVFLHLRTGQNDLILGIPAAGQATEENQAMVGHCVNMLPLRSRHAEHNAFIDYLRTRKPAILDAYEYQNFTFGKLLQKLAVPRDPSRVPLIPVVFNIDIGMTEGVEFEGLQYSLVTNKREYENFEIFLNISGFGDNLVLEWSYNSDLFREATIRRMMTEFEAVLAAISNDPATAIAALPVTRRVHPSGVNDNFVVTTDRQSVRTESDAVTSTSGNAMIVATEIWKEILGLTAIGPDDDFFELGGHSLLAAQIVARMEQATGIRQPVTSIFRRSSLRDFSHLYES